MFKQLRFILIALILFSLGTYKLVNQLQLYGHGLFYLLTVGKEDNLSDNHRSEMLKGDHVVGKFSTPYANLGTVSVRFTNLNRDSRDTLVFRLKENGASSWFYEAKYNTDQFRPGMLFPFGFPIIKDSANKTYIFELESLKGATGSGIFIDRYEPSFTAVSFFDRRELWQHPSLLNSFLIQKVQNVFGTKADLYQVIIFYSPLIFYLLYTFSAGLPYQFLSITVLVGIVFDLFFLGKSNDYYLASVATLWLFTAIRFDFESSISSWGALIFMLLTPLLHLFGQPAFAAKTAIWSFLFFVVSFLQQIRATRQPSVGHLTALSFIKNWNYFSLTNHFLHKAYRVVLILIMGIILLNIYHKIIYGLSLFHEFFPEMPTNQLEFYFLASICTLFISSICFLIAFKRQFKNHPLLLAIYFYIVFQATSFITADMTVFQHRPKIFSITPNTTSEAWTDIILTGRNFQDLPFVGKIYLSGVEQGEYLISWSDNRIVFRTSPTLTQSGQVCVHTLSKGQSNCLPFYYNFNQNPF